VIGENLLHIGNRVLQFNNRSLPIWSQITSLLLIPLEPDIQARNVNLVAAAKGTGVSFVRKECSVAKTAPDAEELSHPLLDDGATCLA